MRVDSILRIAGLVTALTLHASGASGQAFLEWDLAPRVTALGGAGASLHRDPSAVFYNPAGIVYIEHSTVLVGSTVRVDDSRFRGFGLGEFDREPGPVVNGAAYVTHPIAVGWTGGIGVNSPWGLSVEWDDSSAFVGRFRSTDADLRSINVNPVLAYGPVRGWSAALGLDVVSLAFDITRFEQDPELSALGGLGPIALARSALDTDGTDVGWNAALMFRPDEYVTVGLQYRSGFDPDLNGILRFVDLAPADLRALPRGDGTLGDELDARFETRGVRVPFALPAHVSGGIALQIVPEVSLRGDVQWFDWSDVDAIRLEFNDAALNEETRLDYEDAWAIRAGAEVELRPGAAVRVGYAWEDTPAPNRTVTPLLPDAARNTYSLGIGLATSGLELDFSYRLTILDDRPGVAFPGARDADGVFETTEHRLGASLTRSF